MFTGIVSGLGRVREVAPGRLVIEHGPAASRVTVGGSIAVNGVCLTVVEREGDVFAADVVDETLRRTNLGGLGPGDAVNLELPLTMAQGLDGHIVQGHVDGTGTVVESKPARIGRELTFRLPRELARYVAEKGSIAIDGVSLTVAGLDVRLGTFMVALIPHTLENTVARAYTNGTVVNLEVDLLARYLERLLAPPVLK